MPEGDFGAEVRVKKSKRVIGIMLAGVLVLGMAGCGKKNTYQGGEGTNFPYTWKEESKGSVLIRLDGKYGPEDYRWTAVNSDEQLPIRSIKQERIMTHFFISGCKISYFRANYKGFCRKL